jgi:hypothetical protein
LLTDPTGAGAGWSEVRNEQSASIT